MQRAIRRKRNIRRRRRKRKKKKKKKKRNIKELIPHYLGRDQDRNQEIIKNHRKIGDMTLLNRDL
jgi:hypothetical protein